MKNVRLFPILNAVTLIFLFGCDRTSSGIRNERKAASVAVQKLGGGGISVSVVHSAKGVPPRNRIELNFVGERNSMIHL